MSTVYENIARVRAYATHRGWTKSKFAEEAGVNDTTLRKFHDDDWNPTAETLMQLESIIPPDFQPPQKGAPSPQPEKYTADSSTSKNCSSKDAVTGEAAE